MLTNSEGHFESIFEQSPYAIFIHDFDRIVNVNQAFLALYGYESKSDIVGKPAIKSIIFHKDIDIIKNARKVGKQDPFFIPAVRVVRADGSRFFAEAHASTVILDQKPHLQISTRDITAAMESAGELMESERRYRTLFESSLDGIYKSTPDGKFVAVNPALVSMLGYDSVEELLAIDIETELYFQLEDRKIMAAHEEDKYPLKKKDGTPIWVEDHSYYEFDENEEILFHHGILRDVTQKLEKQNELEGLLAMTKDQNERLQNFAHIISHNIRSHSANLSSLVHIMEEKENIEERDRLFSMLKTSTMKLEETIQNLNEIITVNRNLSSPLESRNLADEVNNTLNILSGDILSSSIELSRDIPANLSVRVIPAYLDSILLNLVSNAIKYRAQNAKAYIKISAEQDDKCIVLHVTDNGVGIDLIKNSEKIFRMYETFNYNKDSRGFGLYITKNQIEAMGGRIDVKSKLGAGSTFSVYFKK